jgi:hypothetical protein
MAKFRLKAWLVVNKYHQQEDPDQYMKGTISVKFFYTEDGVEMINCVDTSKPRHSWQFFKFRTDHITSEDDWLWLLEGSTVKR